MALVLRGELARDLGDRTSAKASFAAAAAADPGNLWAHLHLAAEHRRAGNLAEAEAAAETALTISPGHSHAFLSLGQTARAAGDRARALARFRAARDADPANRWGWLTLAEELRDAGTPDEAETVLREMLLRFPADGQALIGLGLCARLRRDLDAARAFFAQATVAAENDGWGWHHLAQANLDLGDVAAADAAARRAEQLLPNQGAVLMLLANCARRHGARDEALGLFARATEVDPGNHWAWIGLARLHQDEQAWDAARDALRTCLAQKPGQVQALLALARLEEEAGAMEAAEAALAEAVAAEPLAPAPIVAQAKLASRRGDAAAAWTLAQRARQLAPHDPAPVEMLAEVAASAGDTQAAEALYREAAALAPGRPWAHIGVARMRVEDNDVAGALAVLETAAADHGPAAELTAMRIHLLTRAGEWPTALQTAREATSRWTDAWLHEQRVMIELQHAGPDAAAAALVEFARHNPGEQARHARLSGMIAEARWQIDDARAHYRRALALEPRNEGTLNDAIRVALLRCDLTEARLHIQSLVRGAATRQYRASHTVLGNLANEYALDPPLLAELTVFSRLAPAERANALSVLVRVNPDSTGPALQLMVALREAGLLRLREKSDAGSIPRRICQYWSVPEPPAAIRTFMASWEEHHPGWAIERFDKQRAFVWLREHFPRPVSEAFRSARTEGIRADLLRLAWLNEGGGFGADPAARCLVPNALGAEGIAPAGADLVLAFDETGAPSNEVIGAGPGHAVIRAALEAVVRGINRGDNDGRWLMTGSGMLARILAGALSSVGQALRGCYILDRHELGRSIATQCHEPRKAQGRARAPRTVSFGSGPG